MQLPVLLMMKARRVRARCAKGGPTDAPHDRPDGQELQLLLLSTRHKYVQHKLQAQCLEIYRGQRVGLSLLQQLLALRRVTLQASACAQHTLGLVKEFAVSIADCSK